MNTSAAIEQCRQLGCALMIGAVMFLSLNATLAVAEVDESSQVTATELRALLNKAVESMESLAPRLTDSSAHTMRYELYSAYVASLSNAYVSRFVTDAAYPEFVPAFNKLSNFWAVNPDGVYRMAPIDPAGVYRVSGVRGSTRIADLQVGIGAMVPLGEGGLGQTVANYSLYDLEVDERSYFSVIISGERPEDHRGDWWALHPDAKYLIVRQFASDWHGEIDTRLAIERLDRPAAKPRPSVETLKSEFDRLGNFAHSWLETSFDYIEHRLKKPGLKNKIEAAGSLGDVGGFSRQIYLQGLFELQPDEALVYETEVPESCRYWNIHLTDEMWRTLDWQNRQTSLNDFTAKLDSDGKLRVVISAQDPGVANWLDTMGYATGTIFGRWTECSSTPEPKTTLVKIADIDNYLLDDSPRISSAERDASIRARREGAQLRQRW